MSDAPIAYIDANGIFTFRASAASKCEAALVHSLRGLEPLPPGEDMQRRFNDGHLHEASIIAAVEEAGWDVIDSQREVSIDITDKIRLVGHIDGIGLKHGAMGLQAVVEAKSMSQGAFEKWMAKGFDAYPGYAQQITVYMKALNMPAVYACKNKNSGAFDIRMIEAPPYLLAKIKAKLIRVVKAYEADKLPLCPKTFDFPCPYFHLHEAREKGPHKNTELGVDPTELRPELEEAAHNYQEATSQEKYWKDRRTELKTEMLEKLGNESTAATDLYDIEVSRTSTKRLNTGKLRSAYPDLTQYEDVGETVTLKVKLREGA